MTSITGIPTTRVSDQFIRQRLLEQTQGDQLDLFRMQTQLSTGRRFELPSEDPIAALRIMNLQRLLERKEQVQSNLATNQSYLSSTDVAMSAVSRIVSEVRADALGVIGTTTTEDQRRAAIQQVDQAIRQLIDVGNQKFRGRYLFAGSDTQVEPFGRPNDRVIQYSGNENSLYSYSDTDLLFETNISGSQAFGALSQVVRGSADLNPVLTFDTRLADLRGGQGIHASAILVSDGRNRTVIDVSSAETIGDVALLIRNNPPAGRTLDVEVTHTGLKIRLVPDPSGTSSENLSIREVGGGTTAGELGILNKDGVGNDWLVGQDLNPVLRKTTSLDNILGRRAWAAVRADGNDNDFILEATTSGAAWNGTKIVLADDPMVTVGNERVEYAAGQVTVFIDEGNTQTHHVVEAIQLARQNDGLPFSARLDPVDSVNGGRALVVATPAGQSAGITADGGDPAFDRTSGIQIVNGGNTYTIEFGDAETVEDLLNALNNSAAGVLAEINAAGTGLDVRSRWSGADFAIGENGGSTASQLGLRTFTLQTRLDNLNYGVGIHQLEGGAASFASCQGATPNNDLRFAARSFGTAWDGFSIEFVNTGTRSVAYDRNAKTLTFTIDNTTTANDILALVAADEDVRADFDVTLMAEGGQPNNGHGLVDEGVWTTAGGSDEGVDFTITRADGVEMKIDLSGSVTIEDVLRQINHHPANAPLVPGGSPALEARLAQYGNGIELVDNSGGTGRLTLLESFGSSAGVDLGLIPKGETGQQGEPSGPAQVIRGSDVDPQETQGLFTALLRLQEGLTANDLSLVSRAMEMLDSSTLQSTFVRAELGARQQGLDVLKERLDGEEVELRTVLSLEHDADIVEVVSKLAAKQAAFQASMMATGKIFQMSLLNYL